jgi:uncharacterized protein (DUF2236 family)
MIRDEVYSLVGNESGTPTPRADDGLFGPQSVSWRVHGDFTSMMVGGISALMLQMLHPLALAGVWDHSDFRRDMTGRLRRTARFISATTFGSRETALAAIDRVRVIHDRVHGYLPDGTRYDANDPRLLAWIHVAEMTSFLAAYRRYRESAISLADQDRYFAENVIVAERLGAHRVPATLDESVRFLQAMRRELRFDTRTFKVASALMHQQPRTAMAAPFGYAVMRAGLDLLPDWALRMHGLRQGAVERTAVRISIDRVGDLTRWALR